MSYYSMRRLQPAYNNIKRNAIPVAKDLLPSLMHADPKQDFEKGDELLIANINSNTRVLRLAVGLPVTIRKRVTRNNHWGSSNAFFYVNPTYKDGIEIYLEQLGIPDNDISDLAKQISDSLQGCTFLPQNLLPVCNETTLNTTYSIE